MPRLLLITFSLLLVFSCKQRSNYSGDHLSKEVMQKLILDVNTAEAYSIVTKDSLHKGGSKNVDSLSAFYSRIFAHYKITEEEFNKSLEWYKTHPEELDTIYAHILPIAIKMQAQAPPSATPPAPPQPALPLPGPGRTTTPATTHLSIIHPAANKGAHEKPKVSRDNNNSN